MFDCFSEPAIPYIKHHDFIKTVFPEDYSNILWLYAAHTFPLFCKLLELPEYTERLMIGLIASIGQLTESLVRIHHSTVTISLSCFVVVVTIARSLLVEDTKFFNCLIQTVSMSTGQIFIGVIDGFLAQ